MLLSILLAGVLAFLGGQTDTLLDWAVKKDARPPGHGAVWTFAIEDSDWVDSAEKMPTGSGVLLHLSWERISVAPVNVFLAWTLREPESKGEFWRLGPFSGRAPPQAVLG